MTWVNTKPSVKHQALDHTTSSKWRDDVVPMTTRLSNGFPPCLFSSSARMSSCRLLFPAERDWVGVAESSDTHAGLVGVSVAGRWAMTSGLGPLRTDEGTTPFSSALCRHTTTSVILDFKVSCKESSVRKDAFFLINLALFDCPNN